MKPDLWTQLCLYFGQLGWRQLGPHTLADSLNETGPLIGYIRGGVTIRWYERGKGTSTKEIDATQMTIEEVVAAVAYLKLMNGRIDDNAR